MPDPGTYQGYCEYCDEQQPIQKTVPWQTDVCAVCAHPVEDDN
jgi:hypothetical protein